MKTAISVPDALFAQIDAKVAELGTSRSEFFADAARRHLDALDADRLTARIDEAIARGTVERIAGRELLARYTAADEW